MRVLRASDHRSMPWKNGGGTTTEIAVWPEGAALDGFDWRVSVARIAASGPFSTFAGVDRIITLLEGDGVRLHGQDLEHRLATPLAPFAFSGDARVDCTLLGGPSSDFNVMTRRGRLRAAFHVLHRGAELPAAAHGLLLAWRGHWRAGSEALAPGQGLWWSDAAAGWPLDTADADAALLAVQWHPAR